MKEMTVADLREALSEFPDYYPVVPIVNGMEGVMLAARARPVYPDEGGLPSVWVGEIDIPPHLQESVIERRRSLGGRP